MQCSLPRTLLLAVVGVALAGCGGGSSNKNKVAVVNLTPAAISIVAGQVAQLSVSAVDSTANAVATTFTFNSSNPNLVTISPSGVVCGGVWDSTFVVCSGNSPSGAPLTGTATITATAAGISSAPVTVSVHPSVTSIKISAPTVNNANGCLSHGQTLQFTAQAFHNGQDITSLVGQFSWTSSDGTVASVDANGLATANAPGSAGIVAVIGGVTSQSVTFNTCMPKELVLHIAGDPADNFTFSAVMNVKDTRTVQVDMIDVNGTPITPAPVTIVSNNAGVATIAGATVTAVSPGGAGLVAVCAPPRCGNGKNQTVYSNLFSITVNGPTQPTTVYVGTTTIPAPGTSPAIVPIDTSKSPPAAGTPIVLPGAPTSMGFSADGTKFYVDTSSGLVSVDPFTNAATLVDADPIGVILAVSPDGTKVIVSNVKFQADVPSQRLFIFDSSNSTLQTFILPGAVAAAFTSDGSKAYIGAFDPTAPASQQARVYVWSPVQTLRTIFGTGTPNSVASIAAGPLVYVSNGSTVNVLNVCDNSFNTNMATNTAPQLVAAPKNSNTIVALDQSGVNIETANLSNDTIGLCPTPVSYTNEFQAFNALINARKLLVANNGANIAVLSAGFNQIFVAIPGAGPFAIPLSGNGTEPVSGDLTLDGTNLWTGVAGTNTVHQVCLPCGTDIFQIQLNLNNTNAVPDLIAVRPK
jgi:hypothetical protein